MTIFLFFSPAPAKGRKKTGRGGKYAAAPPKKRAYFCLLVKARIFSVLPNTRS